MFNYILYGYDYGDVDDLIFAGEEWHPSER